MKVQNKYMQTHLDNMGKLLYYRVTLPIPKEFALSGKLKPGFVNQVKNTYYYVNQSTCYEDVMRCVNTCQIHVTKWKIKQLQNKIKRHEKVS